MLQLEYIPKMLSDQEISKWSQVKSRVVIVSLLYG